MPTEYAPHPDTLIAGGSTARQQFDAGVYNGATTNPRKQQSPANFTASLNSFVSGLGETVLNFERTRRAIRAGRDIVSNDASGYEYGDSKLLGADSADVGRGFLAQEEALADSFVNSVGRQSRRIGSELVDAYGIYLFAGLAGVAYLAIGRR